MPTQLHSTWVSATSATTVESRLSWSRATNANSTLMVLAGGWGTFWSRAASTWPLSRSATIQVWAGPSGMGTEPIGCIASAREVGAAGTPAMPPQAPTASTAATAAMSFRMGAKCNFPACVAPISARWLPPRHVAPGVERPGADVVDAVVVPVAVVADVAVPWDGPARGKDVTGAPVL